MGVAKQPFQIRLKLVGDKDSTVLNGVEEFVSGFKYLYVRAGSSTLSYHRDSIESVHRKMVNSGEWLPVSLRHPAK